MNQFNIYEDENLTIPFNPAVGLKTKTGGVFSFYLGSPDPLYQYSGVGGIDITLTPTDTTTSSGHETNEIKLALVNDFTGVTPGAPLVISAPILGGIANKVQVFIELTDLTGGGVASDGEISIDINDIEHSLI